MDGGHCRLKVNIFCIDQGGIPITFFSFHFIRRLNDIERATNAKSQVEQKQRDEAKLRKENNEEWDTKVNQFQFVFCFIDRFNIFIFMFSILNPLPIRGSIQSHCHRDYLWNRKTTKDNETACESNETKKQKQNYKLFFSNYLQLRLN